MRFSIILPAYREDKLKSLIDALKTQNLEKDMILDKIIVVACECGNLDKLKSGKVEIIEENVRKGKAYSINSAVKLVNSDIIVLESTDTVPEMDTIKNLLIPFRDNHIGMTTSRPVPSDDIETFRGFVIHLIWKLHHMISIISPKSGEMIAFRNVIIDIPQELAADESYLEYMIKKHGYSVEYVQSAVVHNEGPKSLANIIKQRRRIFNGHLHIKEKYNYSVSTMNTLEIIKMIFKYSKNETKLDKLPWILGAIFLESWSRILAIADFYLLDKLPYKWDVTK